MSASGFLLDNFPFFAIMIHSSHRKLSLRGAGRIRLRLSFVALTREPDTASTVGGKDAHMRYHCVSHCTWTGLQCGIFLQEVEFS